MLQKRIFDAAGYVLWYVLCTHSALFAIKLGCNQPDTELSGNYKSQVYPDASSGCRDESQGEQKFASCPSSHMEHGFKRLAPPRQSFLCEHSQLKHLWG